jgi:hypothetical protein
MGPIELTVERPLDGVVALMAAQSTALCKQKGEKDTEFVKRIVNAYLDMLIVWRAM